MARIAKPKTLTATLTLEDGKTFAITHELDDEAGITEAFPQHAPLFLDWMQEAYKENKTK
jgi:hypothetical protein